MGGSMAAGSPFPPASEDNLLLEYMTVAREHRRRIMLLFLAVAVVFGLVAWIFFDIHALDALMLSCGLGLFIFLALPRTRFVYRMTESGVFVAEYYGDAFDLHRVLPPLMALLMFVVIGFSFPLGVLTFTAAGLGAALFLLRRFFPVTRPTVSHMSYAEVGAVAVDPGRRVFALYPIAKHGDSTERLLIFCNHGELDKVLEMMRKYMGPIPLRDESLIR